MVVCVCVGMHGRVGVRIRDGCVCAYVLDRVFVRRTPIHKLLLSISVYLGACLCARVSMCVRNTTPHQLRSASICCASLTRDSLLCHWHFMEHEISRSPLTLTSLQYLPVKVKVIDEEANKEDEQQDCG